MQNPRKQRSGFTSKKREKFRQNPQNQLKEGQPIRAFGAFDAMPADVERRAKQIFRIIGKSLPREQAAKEMQQAA